MSSTEDILLSILTRYTDTEAIEQQEKLASSSSTSTSSMAFCENSDTGVRSSSSWDYNFQPTTAGIGTNMFVPVQDCGSPPSTLSPSSSIGGVEEVTSIFDNIMIDSQKTIHLQPLPPTIGTNVHTFQQQALQQQHMMNGCFNMVNGNGMLTQFSPGNTSPTIMTSQSPSSSTSMDSDSPYLKNNHKGVKKSNKTTKSTAFSTTMTTSSVSQSSSSPNGVQFVNHSSEEIEYKCRNAATSTNGEKRKRGRPKKEIPVSKNITFVQDGYNKGFKK